MVCTLYTHYTARICPPGIEGVFMTVLTSIINIAMQVSGQLSALIISWMGIECEEDPEDENEVLCVFDYLWLLIVVVNLTTLIPLIFIKKIPDEEQLRLIGEELKARTIEQEEKQEHPELDQPPNVLQREQMIALYWCCTKRVFPFCKKRICCCACCGCQEVDFRKRSSHDVHLEVLGDFQEHVAAPSNTEMSATPQQMQHSETYSAGSTPTQTYAE